MHRSMNGRVNCTCHPQKQLSCISAPWQHPRRYGSFSGRCSPAGICRTTCQQQPFMLCTSFELATGEVLEQPDMLPTHLVRPVPCAHVAWVCPESYVVQIFRRARLQRRSPPSHAHRKGTCLGAPAHQKEVDEQHRRRQ